MKRYLVLGTLTNRDHVAYVKFETSETVAGAMNIRDCDLTEETATVDHYFPLGAGGHNGSNNMRLACADCNHAKGDKMPSVPVVELSAEENTIELYDWV